MKCVRQRIRTAWATNGIVGRNQQRLGTITAGWHRIAWQRRPLCGMNR
jgi:hypothetical protein